jgi:microsomal epoxide hydrolase
MVNPGFGLAPLGAADTLVPFTLHVPDTDISQLSSLVQSAVIRAPSFYNTHNVTTNSSYDIGISRDWLANAAEAWVHDFDWRALETRWNALPQFTVSVTVPSDGQVFDLHFGALFSRRSDAVPVILSHGWPSSWLDYAPLLELLAAKYTPETLPYHVVTPSIPDYGLSTRSRVVETEVNFYAAAEALNELMKTLGFTAYIAQGGDVGSAVTAALGASYDECKAVLCKCGPPITLPHAPQRESKQTADCHSLPCLIHFQVNNFLITATEGSRLENLPVTPEEKATIAAAQQYLSTGTGYLLEQGTKPGTISLVLMTNPLALLGWYVFPYITYLELGPRKVYFANSRHKGLAPCTPRSAPSLWPRSSSKSRGIGTQSPTAGRSGPTARPGPPPSGTYTPRSFPLRSPSSRSRWGTRGSLTRC